MMEFSGISLCPCAVTGRAFVFSRHPIPVKLIHTENTELEKQRLLYAKETAVSQLSEIYSVAVSKVGTELAGIFRTHIMMITDDDFLDAVFEVIDTQLVNAEYAVSLTAYNFANIFAAMDDKYMKARAADIRDISTRLTAILSQLPSDNGIELCESGNELIICTDDLLPSEVIMCDIGRISAFVTANGSENSHSAILAAKLGIPAVVCVGDEFLNCVSTGDIVTVNGLGNKVILPGAVRI